MAVKHAQKMESLPTFLADLVIVMGVGMFFSAGVKTE